MYYCDIDGIIEDENFTIEEKMTQLEFLRKEICFEIDKAKKKLNNVQHCPCCDKNYLKENWTEKVYESLDIDTDNRIRVWQQICPKGHILEGRTIIKE